MKKIVSILMIIAVIAIIWVIYSNQNTLTNNGANNPVDTVKDQVLNTGEPAKIFTMIDVANHNGEGDCWTAINGKIYNLTEWIHKHPGGDRNILKICGIDGSKAFDGQHGSSNQALATLTSFYVGDLNK